MSGAASSVSPEIGIALAVAAAAVLGGAIALRIVGRGRRSDRGAAVGWGPLDAGIVAAVFVVFHAVLSSVLSVTEEAPLVRRLYAQFAAYALAAGAAILLARARDGRGLRALGLVPDGSLRALGSGVLAYPFFLPTFVVAAFAGSALLGPEAPGQEVLAALGGTGGASRVLAFVGIVALGPAFEELYFRGFLQRSLERSIGSGGALLVAAAAFGLVHEPVAALPVFALGAFLGLLFRRTGRLLPCVGVHALHNGLTAGLWLRFPQLRDWTPS